MKHKKRKNLSPMAKRVQERLMGPLVAHLQNIGQISKKQ